MLGLGVIYRDYWIFQLSLVCQAVKPDNAGGSFFGTTDYVFNQIASLCMKHGDKVGSIIDSQVRFMVEGCGNMMVIGYVIFSLDSVRGNSIFHQCGGYVILGAERIGSAEYHFRSACL